MSISEADFHGIWSLSRWTVLLADSEKERKPFGGDVEGYLIYHPQGWVSASLMQREREHVSQERMPLNTLKRHLSGGSDHKMESGELEYLRQYFLAAQGYISYAGPFDIDSSAVHHRVKVSLIPQWVGTTLTREYSFSADGSVLTLLAEQEGIRDCLVWERQP